MAHENNDVTGLIFLRFAEARFDRRRAELEKDAVSAGVVRAWTSQRHITPRAFSI